MTQEIEWREWSREAFETALAQDRLILLDIGAVWCHWCHVMDRGNPHDSRYPGTYSDSRVQQLIADHFVPIKVDTDRRPDINARYNMGGWPTTAVLTPAGDILYGATYVPPDSMVQLLERISFLYQTNKRQLLAQAAELKTHRAERERTQPAEGLDPETVAAVIESIKDAFDPQYGGFGTQPKFPHPAALHLVLEEYAKTGDSDLKRIAETTLSGMAHGGMYDQFAGGFFRYSTTRNWSIPHYEKMLEDNALLTRAYTAAASVLDDESWLDTVRSTHDWLFRDLCDAKTGVFAGSQDADSEELYYGQPLETRVTLPTPYIDRTIYADWNALMVTALAARFQAGGEADVLMAAERAYRFLRERMARPAGRCRILPEMIGEMLELRHFTNPASSSADLLQSPVGLLADQVAFGDAALNLYETTGEYAYCDDALACAGYILQFLAGPEHGGFFDILPTKDALGDLSALKKDLSENSDAALFLLKLASLTGRSEYRESAESALRAFAASYRHYSFHAASYARAVDAALQAPPHIVLVGDEEDKAYQALLRAAWQTPIAARAVERLSADDATKRGFATSSANEARAYVCIGQSCREARSAEELRSLLKR